MRRPMPPELVVLGDHLELATRRALGRRRTRRQQVLNALTSIAVALPLVATALQTVGTPPEVVVTPNQTAFGRTVDDFPPRLLHRVDHPSADVLYEATTLRRALR